MEEPGEPSATALPAASVVSKAAKRKHRPGLQRVQIACERCRIRKNKCDGSLPECSACRKAGVSCTMVDRVTYRQYARGHVEGLETTIEKLNARVQDLMDENQRLRAELDGARNAMSPLGFAASTTSANAAEGPPTIVSDSSGIAEDFNVIPFNVTSEKKYVGDSSGSFFGQIVEAVLLRADYKHEQGPSRNRLRLRVGGRRPSTNSRSVVSSRDNAIFPSPDLADKLQEAYFSYRWPSLPFLHRPSFLEKHYIPSMTLKFEASPVSLFLTFMVFALGAIDMRRQNSKLPELHLDYFRFATQHYIHGLTEADDASTVQGLLLVGLFAINEHRSANAWHVAGQAVRMAVDLGLHRDTGRAGNSLLFSEMKKRIFWSAYALDRNVSIALGRPCALHDSDINAQVPLCLTDEELTSWSMENIGARPHRPTPKDMSSFIQIIKIRQIQSKIQDVFYPAHTVDINKGDIEASRQVLRLELDDWISQVPRYPQQPVVTFQSMEWFQIAYSHALLLLYRPTPICPVATSEALKICSDSAISLISSYSTLYAKNKITYTWIALHSLFMASVTMLYTLLISSEIRLSTNETVVRSNIQSCLALFQVMSEFWPLAGCCYDIIDRLGSKTVALFSQSEDLLPSATGSQSNNQPRGHIDSEFMDWFGATAASRLPTVACTSRGSVDLGENGGPSTGVTLDGLYAPSAGGLDFSSDLDNMFHQGFDMTIPIMMDAFDTGLTADVGI